MTRFKRFGQRPGRSVARPTRTWASVDAIATGWDVGATGTQGKATLIEMQAPGSLASLTSDPPEDITILRLVGRFQVILSTGPAIWTMGLTVQDTSWTQGATFSVDSDKRWLWSRTFESVEAAVHTWTHGGHLSVTGTNMVSQVNTAIDIKPMVKIEPGKALYLVYYEASGAASFTTNSQNMRVLFQRSQRRR